jgi:hypothetical protein
VRERGTPSGGGFGASCERHHGGGFARAARGTMAAVCWPAGSSARCRGRAGLAFDWGK